MVLKVLRLRLLKQTWIAVNILLHNSDSSKKFQKPCCTHISNFCEETFDKNLWSSMHDMKDPVFIFSGPIINLYCWLISIIFTFAFYQK